MSTSSTPRQQAIAAAVTLTEQVVRTAAIVGGDIDDKWALAAARLLEAAFKIVSAFEEHLLDGGDPNDYIGKQ
jgi:hypothetical protein